jgi:hypothetical protein
MLHGGIEYTVKRAATPGFGGGNFVFATGSKSAGRNPNQRFLHGAALRYASTEELRKARRE